jgi:CRISPR/Cas system-associated endonuclease Cas3-HD
VYLLNKTEFLEIKTLIFFSKDLANATGNILENKELLESLNKTKEKSATITNSLEESVTLGEDLDKVKRN